RHHGSSRHRPGPAGDAHRDHPSTGPPPPMRERTARDDLHACLPTVVRMLRLRSPLPAGAEYRLLRRVPADTTAHRPATGVGACPWDEQGTWLRRGMETTVPTRAPAPALVLRLRTHGSADRRSLPRSMAARSTRQAGTAGGHRCRVPLVQR